MARYRIYIDEVGNHDMRNCEAKNERYLSLFGVIIETGTDLRAIQAEMKEIKQEFFPTDPDEEIVFHRTDMKGTRKAFQSMYHWNVERRDEFNNHLLGAFNRWAYTAIVVTIDKKDHLDRYGSWVYEPYYYCFKVLMEKYVQFLKSKRSVGDVMIEARGKKQDHNLKLDYTKLFATGTQYISSEIWQNHLTSRQLKVKSKKANIAGLQLADLLAHSAHYDNLNQHNRVDEQKAHFGRQISGILNKSKYRKGWNGGIRGYGRKMLP